MAQYNNGYAYNNPMAAQPVQYDPQPPQYMPPGPVVQPMMMQPMVQPMIIQAPVLVPAGAELVSPPMNDPMVDGLSYFPSLVVKQKVNSFWEVLCNCEEENKYAIYNPMGGGKEKILTAKEKSGYCTRMCLAEKRHFLMSIRTNDEQEALYFERPYRIMERGGWCCCSSKCGFQALRVYGGAASKAAERMLGYVQEDYYLLFPVLSVFDENGALTYRVKMKRSCETCCCSFARATFDIFEEADRECERPVGKIRKKWSGALKELFTDADNFFIEFPVAATAKQRATLLGALFFIDYLYYEDGGLHLLHYLGAPLMGPCACLGWCGSLALTCLRSTSNN